MHRHVPVFIGLLILVLSGAIPASGQTDVQDATIPIGHDVAEYPATAYGKKSGSRFLTDVSFEPIAVGVAVDTFSITLTVSDADIGRITMEGVSGLLTKDGVSLDRVEFLDDGQNGDSVAGDLVFSASGLLATSETLIDGLPVGSFNLWARDYTYHFASGAQESYQERVRMSIRTYDRSALSTPTVREIADDIRATDYVINVYRPPQDELRQFSYWRAYSEYRIFSHFPDDIDFLVYDWIDGGVNPRFSVGGTYHRLGEAIPGVHDRDRSPPQDYGSQGRLKGQVSLYYRPNFRTLNHEINHNWFFSLHRLAKELDLFHSGEGHWYGGVAQGSSGFGGARPIRYEALGGGEYREYHDIGLAGQFSDLEMYYMGLLPADSIQDVQVLSGGDQLRPEHIRTESDSTAIVRGDSLYTYTISDLTGLTGERYPPHPDAQADFTAAYVVYHDRLLTPEEFAYFDYVAREYENPESEFGLTFEAATRGIATMKTRLPDRLTSNPVLQPPVQLSPAEGDVVEPVVTFQWEPQPVALSYTVRIFDRPVDPLLLNLGPGEPGYDAAVWQAHVGTTGGSYWYDGQAYPRSLYGTLLPDGTYYWTIATTTVFGSSHYSPFRSFEIRRRPSPEGWREPIRVDSTSSVPSVLSVDVDADGTSELITANHTIEWPNPPTSSALVLFRDLMDGADARRVVIDSVSGRPYRIAAFDFDGDNDSDLLVGGDVAPAVRIYENTDGFGDYTLHATLAPEWPRAEAITTGDVDGDGDADIVASTWGYDRGETSGEIAWFENEDGKGTFLPRRIIATGFYGPVSLTTADVDGDGDSDVVAGVRNWDVVWYENTDGAGEFGTEHEVTGNAQCIREVEAADVDSDGDIDLFSTNRCFGKVSMYENLGGGQSFSDQIVLASAAGSKSLVVSDLNGDGVPDVVSSGLSVENQLRWFPGTDAGRISGRIVARYPGASDALTAGDFDGDGDIDLVNATYTGRIELYENRLSEVSTGRDSDDLPATTRVASAYPNPFRTGTVLAVDLAAGGEVRLTMVDVLGRRVATVAKGYFEPGRHVFRIPGDDLAAGTYFLRLEAPDSVQSRAVIKVN